MHPRRAISAPLRARLAVPLLAIVLVGTTLAATAPAADPPFNVTLVGQMDPLHPDVFPDDENWDHIYGDVWVDGNYAYLGTDVNGGGVSIFDVSVPSNPTFLRNPLNPSGPITMPTYAGHQMEDIEVYNGIGYFGSDVTTFPSGTGVDVVDLSDPTHPVRISRIDGDIGGHNKVHTLSYNDGFLYTSDNATDTIKIFDVSDPGNPVFKWTVDLDLPSGQASHEVVVKNGRMYVASKNNNFGGPSDADPDDATSFNTGTTAIYDVTNVASAPPTPMKLWATGARSHTGMVSEDGNLLVVAQERPNGNVLLYDISMIDEPNDPDMPILLSTLNRTNVGIDAYSPHHPHLHGDMLILSWYNAGVQIFNIADPSNPVRTGSYDTFTGPTIDYDGNWGNFIQLNAEGILQNVFLSDRTKGLIIVDVSDAASTGDFNQDSIVDGRDMLAWQRNLGVASNATLAMGDGNRDKNVGLPDLDVWKFQFGEDGSHHAVTAVPEGASLWIAAAAMAATAGGARRRSI